MGKEFKITHEEANLTIEENDDTVRWILGDAIITFKKQKNDSQNLNWVKIKGIKNLPPDDTACVFSHKNGTYMTSKLVYYHEYQEHVVVGAEGYHSYTDFTHYCIITKPTK